MKIAYFGTGLLGSGFVRHQLELGVAVNAWNRTAAKAQPLAADGAVVFDDPAGAIAGVDQIHLTLADDASVDAVLEPLASLIAPGTIIVDHTTTSAVLAREMAARAAQHGGFFLDAPVSGGQAGAEKGQLSVMIGGDGGAVARAEPAIGAYAKAIRHMGEAGAGQLTKMVNQICIAGVVQGLAEAVAFAAKAGLDPDLVYQAVSQGAAQSWQMDNRWATMARGEFDFGFAVDWMRKDLGLVLAEARANGARLEITALVDQFYAEVQSMGGRRWDTSSLAARLLEPRDAQ